MKTYTRRTRIMTKFARGSYKQEADEGSNEPIYAPKVRKCSKCGGNTFNYFNCYYCLIKMGDLVHESLMESHYSTPRSSGWISSKGGRE